jgi:hypothetical protein
MEAEVNMILRNYFMASESPLEAMAPMSQALGVQLSGANDQAPPFGVFDCHFGQHWLIDLKF